MGKDDTTELCITVDGIETFLYHAQHGREYTMGLCVTMRNISSLVSFIVESI